jgi:hypothetical protein
VPVEEVNTAHQKAEEEEAEVDWDHRIDTKIRHFWGVSVECICLPEGPGWATWLSRPV